MEQPQPLQLDLNRIAVGSFIAAITVTLLVVGRGFLIPLAVALLLWSLLDALRVFYQRLSPSKFKMPSWVARVFSIATIIAIQLFVYGILVEQEDALRKAAPVYQANFAQLATQVAGFLQLEQTNITDTILQRLDIGAMVAWLGGSAGSFLSDIVLVLIYLGFLIAEQGKIPEKLTRFQPDPEKAKKTQALFLTVSYSVQRYILIKTAASILTALVSYSVLALMGVDFAAVWALIIFFLNFIPNVGSILGVVFPALLTLLQFDTLTPFFVVIVGLGGAQFFIGNVAEPSLMGRSLNLSSFMIILSLTFWGLVWGIAGMFLAVPMMVVTGIVCSQIANLRWIAVLLSSDGRLMTTNVEAPAT